MLLGACADDPPPPKEELVQRHQALAPVAHAASFATSEDTTLVETLSGEVGDGDSLTFLVTAAPLRGQVSVDPETAQFTYTPGTDLNGADTFRFVVNDGVETSAEATVTVTVAAVNDRPVIIGVADHQATEGALLTFDLQVTDVDGDDLAIVYALPAGATVAAGVFRWTPTYTQAGEHVFAVSVDDGQGGSAFRSARITVANTNRAPIISDTSFPEGTEGAALTYSVAATDPDGDALLYTWSFGDGQSATGASVQHTFRDDGTFAVSVTVSDGALVTDSSADIVIGNVSPLVQAPEDRTVDEGDVVTLVGQASDPGAADVLSYAWEFGDGASGAGSSASHRYGQDGVFTATLTVTDDDDGVGTDTTTIVVENVAPTVDVAPVGGLEGGLLVLRAQVSDPGDDDFTYAWDFTGDGQTDSTEASPVVRFLNPGTFPISVAVHDGSATTTAQSTATILNVRPDVGALSINPSAPVEGQAASLSVTSVSEPGSQPADLVYSWSFGDGTELDGQGLRSVSKAWTADGTYTVTLTVADGEGEPTTVTQQVTVQNGRPNVMPGPDQQGLEGALITLTANATDPGGDPLTWTWAFGDGQVETGANLESVTHTYADQGVYPVRVTVDDGDGGTHSASLLASIDNVAPTVQTAAERVVGEGTHTFAATASDPGTRDTLTWDWSVTCDEDGCLDTVAVVGPQGPSVQLRFGRRGSYTVRVVVTDKDGASAAASTDVTVDGAAPSLELAVEENPLQEGSVATLVATASDPLPLTWAWDFGDGASDAVQSGQRQHRYVQDGDHVARVTVTALDGDSAQAEVLVTVVNGAPSVTLGSVQGSEGAPVTLVAQATDPGAQDVLSYAWNFGDGQTATTDIPAITHTWAGDGTYDVTLTVSDGTASDIATAASTIINVAPTLTVPAAVVAQEGAAVPIAGVAVDPGADTFTWTWVFGEGVPTQSGDLPVVRPVFPNDGVYHVAVTVSDGLEEATAEVVVEVQNVAPSLRDPVDVTGAEGSPVTFSTAAFDVDADTLTWTWSFGDGEQLVGEDLHTVTHTYQDDGVYAVTLTVTDGDFGTVQNTRRATISNVAPTLGEPLQPRTLSEGELAIFSITVVDPSTDRVDVCWTFGDGEPDVCGRRLTTVERRYADDGPFTLVVTLRDQDGGSNAYDAPITVQNVNPTGAIAAPLLPLEGVRAEFRATHDDPGADTLSFAWDFEPGEGDEQIGDLDTVRHTFSGDGEFTVRLTISDGDGGSVALTANVVVGNVAPAFQTRPVLYVQPGQPYRYDALAIDVPSDDVSYGLTIKPLGMTVAADGLVTWTAQDDPGTVPVRLDATDGLDTTLQSWSLQVGYEDTDGDGAPDDCERNFGLNPDDPEDGARDADGDGATNAEECLRGDDPRVQEGPQPPSVHAPLRGAIVASSPVEMAVNNSPGVGDDARVAFQLFADEGLRELLTEIVVPQGDLRTSWFVDRAYTENGRYFWRARTLTGAGNSAWTRPSPFIFSAVNDAPPAPTLTAPRGPIQEAFPTFVLTAPRDPEDEIIHVEMEVKNASDAVIAGTMWDAIGGEELQFTLPGDVDLVEDHPYSWRARAIDVRRNEGPWSAPVAFRLNNLREAPPAPELLVPAQGDVVGDAGRVDFVARTVVDPDGDRVVYDFQLLSEGEFGTILAEAFGLQVEPSDEVVVWSPILQGNLEEDAQYTWTVQARDNAAASPVSRGTFRFSADDRPPRQVEVVYPQAGARVASLTEPLVWYNVDDPEGQPVHYTVEIWRDVERTELQQRTTNLAATGPEGTQMSWSGALLEDNQDYHWRVKAIDADGVEAPWSGLSPFVVDVRPQAPSVPVPLRPTPAGGVVDGPGVELAWTAVTDPEGAQVTYAVELFDASGARVANMDLEGDGAEVTWTTPALGSGAYTWRVLATDGTLTSAWSDSARFTLARVGTAADDVPSAPRAADPPGATGCSAAGARPARRWGWWLRR